MSGYQTPSEPLRTKFLYSNYMYTLAGYVAEQMSGKSWEALVRETLFQPLGMNDSGFVNEVKNFSQISPAFVYIDGKQEKVDQNLL
jgi:CubicO group peptidase (beta-lactamase class C family)